MLGKTWFRVLAFAFCCVFAAASCCSAQSANCISVRALDYKKGKPLKNLSITIHLGRPWILNVKTAKTDSTGVVSFCLADPILPNLGLSLDGNSFRSCSGYEFKTATILGSGYLAPDTQCGGRTFKFTENPKPGELVIFVRHVGWLERNSEWP